MSRRRACLAVLVLAAVLHRGDGKVCAETIYYVGPDGGSWHTPGNWSSGRDPVGGDYVRISDHLTVRITADVPDASQFYNVTVGYMRDGTVIQDDGATKTRYLALGTQSGTIQYTGTYVLNGGTMDLRNFDVGKSAGDNSFIMNGGDLTTTGWIMIGHGTDALGMFTKNGGDVTTYSLHIGNGEGASGIFTQNAGDLTTGSIGMGYGSDASGIFTQNGGTVHSTGGPDLGNDGMYMGNDAVYNLNGGSLTLSEIRFDSNTNYLDFNGGALNLEGEWNFNRLAGISRSAFRVFGSCATEDNLVFSDPFVIGVQVYTQISAISEPSTVGLFSMGTVVLLTFAWRRRPSQTPVGLSG